MENAFFLVIVVLAGIVAIILAGIFILLLIAYLWVRKVDGRADWT